MSHVKKGSNLEVILMVDESMQQARRDAEALGADAVALAEAYWQTGIQQ